MIRTGTSPLIITEVETETTDKFGNVLPSIIIKPSAPDLNWKAYDYADAFLSLMTSPTSEDELDIHQLSDDLISIGTLSKFIWLAPYIGGNAADHSLNLRYPYEKGGNRVYFRGAVTHNSDGIVGGANMSARNGLCQSQLDPENFSMGLYSLDSTIISSGSPEMGFGSGFGNCVVLYLGSEGTQGGSPYFSNKTWATRLSFSLTDASGQIDCVLSGSRKAVARNGSVLASSTSNLGFAQAALDGLTALAYPGYSGYNPRRIAMHYVGEHFSDTELADNYTAFQTFQTSRGRNV